MKILSRLSIILLLSIQCLLLFAQQTENWLVKSDPITYGKLYLHSDRESYFQGDAVWFKAYYLDGQTNQLIPGLNNLVVDLIDQTGEVIQTQLLPITNGVSSGNIEIPKDLEQGVYLLRAFTTEQKKIGENAFYHKPIRIYRVKSSLELEKDRVEEPIIDASDLDVSFLPEGGFLLAGQVNTVGVKAIDANGKGINVVGRIIDGNNQFVTSFRTDYQGMGTFYLLPKKNERYSVEIAGNSGYRADLTRIREEGIKFEFLGQAQNNFMFKVSTNSEKFLNKEYYFAILNKGKVVLYKQFVQKSNDSKIQLDLSVMPGGINKAVLLDANLKPISERLIFSENYNINELIVKTNRQNFKTRSEVQLSVFDQEVLSDQNFSTLSVSVIDENVVGTKGPSTDILSWLLIDSELKGNIESPSDYFIDDQDLSSRQKLNLLMLTQGWSNYMWDKVDSNNNEWYNEDGGITIKGRVKKLWNNKPVANGEVVLGIIKTGNMTIAEAKTDLDGRFAFKNLILTDTASVFVQARNDRGRISTEVILEPFFDENPPISEQFLSSLKSNSRLPIELYEQKYNSELAMKAFDPAYGSVLLDEVSVNAERIVVDDVPSRIYPRPAISLKPSSTHESLQNVFYYLQGRALGFRYSNGQVFLGRGPSSILLSSTPLFLLNGVEVPQGVLESLPMESIERAEVYRNANELTLFGMRGSAGAVSVYTKQGASLVKITKYTKGAIAKQIIGYSSLKEFYVPKYTAENLDSERPDNRITLYWNPNVITENGSATLSFFTSDDISRFKVFVEGITTDGKICIGKSEFSVNSIKSSMGN